jgi:hypothetical protein
VNPPDEGDETNMTRNILELWTIYERPKDYPAGFVVRRTVVGDGRHCPDCVANIPHGTPAQPCPLADRVAQFAPDLPRARALVPLGKACLGRSPDDDPAVREVWL